MKRIVTPERMRALERAHMKKTNTPGLVLMERAAECVARALLEMTEGGVLFFCGPGNNGGDGYAAARIFAKAGRKAWVWTVDDPYAISGDARENLLRCRMLGLEVRRVVSPFERPPESCGAVVDALFGTGLARPLEGEHAAAARWINGCGLPVLAVDMPSGTAGLMVRADVTVTFHRMKPCHVFHPGRINAGRVVLSDIGIEDVPCDGDFELLEDADAGAFLPPRAQDAHKGDCGHALIVAGSPGMAGAAALSANAAMRGGVGLVTVACPKEIMPAVQALAPCATCVLQEDAPEAARGKRAVAVGPGLGRGDGLDALLESLRAVELPQVWDADALNWLAAHPRRLTERFVITPHPGEAARLLGASVADIAADPVAAAGSLFEKFGAVALLKGATSVIMGAGKRALNATGSPGMATGGCGDVLTGLIAAFLAQGLAPFDAARLAAHLSGRAGEAAAAKRGVRSMIATDLLDALRID